MKRTHSLITALLVTTSFSPALAQQAEPADPNVDVVSEEYRNVLTDNGIINQQMEINDAILLLQREKDKADAVSALVDAMGHDAVVTLPNGDELDLSKTKAGQQAKIASMAQEQQMIDASLALDQKKVEAEVLTDPSIVEAMKRAREAEIVETLVAKIGPNTVIETSDGRKINLAETTAGKRKTIDDLKVDAELLKVRADLGSQKNNILRIEAEREEIERQRILQEARLERELRQSQQPQREPSRPEPAQQTTQKSAELTVNQIYGDGRALKANIVIDDIPFDVKVGDQLGARGKVKMIDRTSVVIETEGGERKFYIY